MLILLSYTPRNQVGGVNRWVNDFISGFGEENCKHYSWWDVARERKLNPETQNLSEWDKAQILTSWLLKTKKIKDEDIVIGDNWWVFGLEHRERTICVAHGNYGHRTYEDIQNGIPAEFPVHEKVQENFRRRYLNAGRKLVTVSDFIAVNMKKIWGFDSHVINNGIDLNKFLPAKEKLPRKRPLIIHFTTTVNKGLDHIQAIRDNVDADVLLLDEAAEFLNLPKYEALAQADLVVHPSAHEGHPYGINESLSCNVPIVSYNTGLMYKAFADECFDLGEIIDRNERSSETTVEYTKHMLYVVTKNKHNLQPREWIKTYSIENFHKNWKDYLKKEFDY